MAYSKKMTQIRLAQPEFC